MKRKKTILLFGLSIVSLASYVLVSKFTHGVGFPLDDAWIHQTYARNLARTGQWRFQVGRNSAGSTGPLWSVLLSLLYVLDVPPVYGTLFVGFGLLSLMGFLGVKITQWLLPEPEQAAIFAGVLLIFEWHMVWAAGSGMETILFSILVLLVCGFLLKKNDHWFVLGLVTGASVWVRPGGITLLGPVLFVLLLTNKPSKALRGGMKVGFGLLLMLAPYIFFNLGVSGDILPNTFYAKQAEYAGMRNLPFLKRLGNLGLQPLVGAGVVLLPGFVYLIIAIIRESDWPRLAGPLWALGYISLYAFRLPVAYQHGRYIMPAMPILYLWGMTGLILWVRLDTEHSLKRILSRSWVAILVLITVIFWGYGARTYGQEVAVINTEMVRVAHWVAENLEEDVIIAAHDIGALGYYSEQKIVDIAGLVSPDVIPFIRDEERLHDYLDDQNVDYLITFPFWYPELVKHGQVIYRTAGRFALDIGMENMAVYAWDGYKKEGN